MNALRHIVETSGPKKKIGVFTLDIKNAFNSAPWEAIQDAMQDMNIPMYMCRIIGSYLDNRRIQIHTRGNIKEEVLSNGVPQVSVLGPTLWNILYDGLLRKHLPAGESFFAFADDVALVAVAKDAIALGEALTAAAEITRGWLLSIGLQLTIEKSEPLVITNTRTRNDMTVDLAGVRLVAGRSIKYLGLQLDARLNFSQHAAISTAKASGVMQRISKILPNISMAKPRKRRIIGSVVQSILLYGARTGPTG